MNKRDAPILFRPHGPVPGGGGLYNSASNCYVQRMSFQISLVERQASLAHWLSADEILSTKSSSPVGLVITASE